MPPTQLPRRSNSRSPSAAAGGDVTTMSNWSTEPGVVGALARYLERSYAVDYLCLACIIAGWFILQVFATPMHRMFRLDDPSIQFPFAEHERVTSWMSVVYAGLLPLIIIILWCAILRPDRHFSHVSILGFLTCVWLTSFVTDVLKNAIGRPRPDLISRCQPELGTPLHQWVSWRVCTVDDDHILQEGWRSFPSGHSSFSWSGFGYLGFFLASQTHAFNARGTIASICLAVSPFFGSIIIACSRLADYRHDLYDVTAGSLLGFFIAYLTFRHYFPPVSHVQCHIPFERGVDQEAGGFRRVAPDDEEAFIDSAPGDAALSHDEDVDSAHPSYLLRPRAS